MWMASWSSLLQEKGFCFANELDPPIDTSAISTKSFSSSEHKCYYGFTSNGEAIESMEFMDIAFGGKPIANDLGKRKPATCVTAENISFGKDKFGLKLSSSLADSAIQESTLIDLKLGGRFERKRHAQSDNLGEGGLHRRTRLVGSFSQAPYCQVYGCNMDLSSSKDYHKRHRVCEAHSKTPTVIVDGVEQRFCQQCSRFHLLAEFDDSKRSCRRRLAGHNERRRKPSFHILSDKQVTKGLAFIWPDVYSSGLPPDKKNKQASKGRLMRFGHESTSNYQSAVSVAAPTIQELSGQPNLSRALSLLSAQSGASSNREADINPNSIYYPCRVGQTLGKPLGVCSFGEVTASKGLRSRQSLDIDVWKGDFFRRTDFLDSADHDLSPEKGSTVNLLQLVSNLQRVEQQRSSFQPSHEDS